MEKLSKEDPKYYNINNNNEEPGCLYIISTPIGNFDFNVVIRSILYNSEMSYISFSVGSAITAKSLAHSEYEECLVKAKALRVVLEN